MKQLRLLSIVLLTMSLLSIRPADDREVIQTIGDVHFTKTELEKIARTVATSKISLAKQNIR